jgi:hypothetical protein
MKSATRKTKGRYAADTLGEGPHNPHESDTVIEDGGRVEIK